MTYVDFDGPYPGDPLVIRVGDDDWGAFEFDVSDHLPSGVTVTSAEAESYLNGVATDIIEASSVSTTDTTVSINFDATGETSEGRYYIVFTLTLSSGGTKQLCFGPVVVLACP